MDFELTKEQKAIQKAARDFAKGEFSRELVAELEAKHEYPTKIWKKAGDLGFIGVRHEGAAAFAASAYGKLTGRPAACLTIAGPGATNLLTGVWDAKVDRAPLLALTGQVQTQVFGPGAFQDIDLASAFAAVSCRLGSTTMSVRFGSPANFLITTRAR